MHPPAEQCALLYSQWTPIDSSSHLAGTKTAFGRLPPPLVHTDILTHMPSHTLTQTHTDPSVSLQTTQIGITASAGALYASTIFIGIINSITVQPITAEKRGVMYRERAAGMYAVFPWVAGLVSWLGGG